MLFIIICNLVICSQDTVVQSCSPKDTTYTNEFFWLINIAIKLYQKVISNRQADVCNFTPSCSYYGKEVIKKYGIKGMLMAIDRLERCHPLAWRYNDKYYKAKFIEDRGYKLYDPPDENEKLNLIKENCITQK